MKKKRISKKRKKITLHGRGVTKVLLVGISLGKHVIIIITNIYTVRKNLQKVFHILCLLKLSKQNLALGCRIKTELKKKKERKKKFDNNRD